MLCEGMVIQGSKILIVDALGLDGWDWLDLWSRVARVPRNRAIVQVHLRRAGGKTGVQPTDGSRWFPTPIRSIRLAGLATTACHPATMAPLSGFAIVGTQLKYERPGKGTVVTPCTEVDDPRCSSSTVRHDNPRRTRFPET